MGIISSVKKTPKAVKSTFATAGDTIKGLRNASTIQEIVDVMIQIPDEAIDAKVNKLRIQYPDASPADLERIVTKQFRKLAANTSGATGAVAAVPGLGTAAALGVSSAQLIGFVSEAGYYVLTLAHIHGIPMHDMDKRRLLVLTSLMGEQGTQIATSQFGFSTITALKGYATDVQRQTIQKINRTLAKQVSKNVSKKGASAILGRLMPYGIGAALGWVIGRSMAGNVIEGVQHALGKAPERFPYPVTIEVEDVQEVNEIVPSGAPGQPGEETN
ncbi:MAG: hypothetical protein QM234_08605 [Acidobacteriota bacterium]|nr:hypothetical protein [Acidobacteriota bacterium]